MSVCLPLLAAAAAAAARVTFDTPVEKRRKKFAPNLVMLSRKPEARASVLLSFPHSGRTSGRADGRWFPSIDNNQNFFTTPYRVGAAAASSQTLLLQVYHVCGSVGSLKVIGGFDPLHLRVLGDGVCQAVQVVDEQVGGVLVLGVVFQHLCHRIVVSSS